MRQSVAGLKRLRAGVCVQADSAAGGHVNDRLGRLMVVVTGAVLAALRCWPLHGCRDCVTPV
jgi:hypothetical protein